MNLTEARKLGCNGVVRSLTRTGGVWVWINSTVVVYHDGSKRYLEDKDVDAENWEPKPSEPFEAEVWVNSNGAISYDEPVYTHHGSSDGHWRKIRIKEVTE
jgi:hypothetical protein